MPVFKEAKNLETKVVSMGHVAVGIISLAHLIPLVSVNIIKHDEDRVAKFSSGFRGGL